MLHMLDRIQMYLIHFLSAIFSNFPIWILIFDSFRLNAWSIASLIVSFIGPFQGYRRYGPSNVSCLE